MILSLEILALILFLYVAVIIVMFIYQKELMYFPDRNMGRPEDYGFKDIKVLHLHTKDEVRITAWYYPAEGDKETILYFHGNRGHLADRSKKLATFLTKGFGIMAVSYRGYGTSEGRPFEHGFYNDGRAAMEYLINHQVQSEKIIIYGESLGSGVATHIASEYSARALVLEAPYMSVLLRAAEMYRWIPVKYLIKEHFDSIGKMPSVKMPVLILHGELDRTIPVHHGRKLLEAVTGSKKGVFFPKVAHVDFSPEDIAANIIEFLETTSKS